MPVLWPMRHGATCAYISAPPSENFQHSFPRRLTILGSTGSIGRNALAVIEQNHAKFQVKALACGQNAPLLSTQALKFRPPLLAVLNEKIRDEVWDNLPLDYKPEIFVGSEGYAQLAANPDQDMVLSAQSGAAGLVGTLAAALSGHVIALANKESLVLAGKLLRKICGIAGASILPVDSEHFSLFECLCGRGDHASELILTASGGPFRNFSSESLQKVTPSQALNHPSWKMGPKITIDSATLMNKGLEIIEAMHLFGVPASKIRVLIHPQSIVHSLALFQDNSLLAQLAVPDMKLPLAVCFHWPEMPLQPVAQLDLAAIHDLSFYLPDTQKFPALALAIKVAQAESQLPEYSLSKRCIVMNSTNEEAVALFLANKLPFNEIAKIVESSVANILPEESNIPCDDLIGLPPVAQALAISERAQALAMKIADYTGLEKKFN